MRFQMPQAACLGQWDKPTETNEAQMINTAWPGKKTAQTVRNEVCTEDEHK